jgi:indolepyruvate ferredoxin oxidoreductase
MGGEGVPWVGQQPFSNDQHMFANLGDGTYFHSGLLAVRQSIAAGVNITYKILYNDAVAMTGGQQVGERPKGHSVVQIAQSMRAEGAIKIVVVTDEPEKYQGVELAAQALRCTTAMTLDTIQRSSAKSPGTTVIIYDQTCATEKRRRRKRGTLVDPAKRVVINELVCEGLWRLQRAEQLHECGAAGDRIWAASARSTRALQQGLQLREGLLPQLCHGGGWAATQKTQGRSGLRPRNGPLPDMPVSPTLANPTRAGAVWGIIVAGVGGTGVITIGQLLGVAAHLEGKGIVTQDAGGLAPKGWSHLEPRADWRHARQTSAPPASAWRRPTSSLAATRLWWRARKPCCACARAHPCGAEFP